MLDQLRKEVQQAGDVSYMSVDIATMNDILDRIEAQSEVVEAARKLKDRAARIPGENDIVTEYNVRRMDMKRLRQALDNLEEQTDD